MHVGAAVVDRRLGLGRILGLGIDGRTGRGELCAEILGVCGPYRRGAPAEERTQPEAAEEQGQQALHAADATLPPLLAPSVAPSTRSGVQEMGPTETVGRRIRA